MKYILIFTLIIFVSFILVTKTLFAQGESQFVGLENHNGFTTVYLQSGEAKEFISKEGYNFNNPRVKGDYVVWAKEVGGVWQIERYHIPTKTTIQLTYERNNLSPSVSADGRVVWESFVDDSWQIFYFDTLKIERITDTGVSINADVENEYIVFAQKEEIGEWAAKIYSVAERATKDIAVGTEYQNPVLLDKAITFDGETFPLNVDDLFTLDLVPLTSNIQPVTIEDIEAEIESLAQQASPDSEESNSSSQQEAP